MIKQKLAIMLATWFYSGYIPGAPGTAGSLVAWGIAWTVVHKFNVSSWIFLVAAMVLLPIAVWSAETASEMMQARDPANVVIDEVVGQWIALAPAATDSWAQWIVAIVLFRIFDIAKPFGIRRVEAFRGGIGVVADDVVAGACAMIGVLLLRWSTS